MRNSDAGRRRREFDRSTERGTGIRLLPRFFARCGGRNADKTGMSRIEPVTRPPSHSTRAAWAVATALLVCGLTGCGLSWNMFVTPVYRIPPGYSETYRRNLESRDLVPLDTGAGSAVSAPAGSRPSGHGPHFAEEKPATDPGGMKMKSGEMPNTQRGSSRPLESYLPKPPEKKSSAK